MSMVCREVQPWKAECPIFVTELEMSTDCNDVQTLNVLAPIPVTELGMSIVRREEHFENA